MNGWFVTFEGWDPQDEPRREALCTVGNGYLATRGALPEATTEGGHAPGTYVAGVYNRLGSAISGRWVDNESLVNVPDWLALEVRAGDGDWFGPGRSKVLEHQVQLDLRRAVLTRHSRLRDAQGRIVRITQRRMASMRDRHLVGLETTIVAENWGGRLQVRSALDGTVRNRGVARYATLPDRHLVPVGEGETDPEVVHLVVETCQTHIRVAEAARTRVLVGGEPVAVPRELVVRPGYAAHVLDVDLDAGTEVIVEKVVALFTSRDEGICEPALDACDWVVSIAGPFETLLARHVVSWGHIWDRMRIEIGANGDVEQLLRLHQQHILQTVSNNSVGSDVGVPARGLHGEAYRGHVFWDELFVFPFLSLRFPQLTRALLLYRHRRLDQARRAAADAGYRGAMFPWQSASSGREETQTMHLNPVSGRWLPDASHLQRHVNAAIAISVWQYYQATGDLEFMRFYGAELILEIARFWASAATYNHTLDRYEIKGVMGPDEFHEGYPGRQEPGLDNNAYTNLMAVWCLCRAFDLLEDVLPPASVRDLREHLLLDPEELSSWDEISRKMRVCFHDGVISQFEGYEALEELDWDRYQRAYGDIRRMDRILEAEGDAPDRYKIAKQADVLMLFYVLPAEDLAALLERLGYAYDHGLIARNVDYYAARTTNGSSLSRVVEAWVTARRDRERSWKLFCEAVRADYDDLPGGTTAEGIHLGAMAGTIDLIQRCYTGMETSQDRLRLHPVIPAEMGSLSYDVRYRGQLVMLEVTPAHLQVRVDLAEGAPITVEVRGERYDLRPGETLDVDLT